ncbi:molybdopterin molybdotransferase MoeA [Rugosimonospora africana]|uniref:Molybdopterin molybdenumtransferase n=1 Tax=Rugosimonospora africana TaxID=556532 RepID=A0A8J3QM80_9ACTN|nr:molybdopterin molybdotransferase MoeA [Rugosimonospora africana]GIH13171.1 molybdopterin molybdenumtransferase MoeA [Rugosimonospora africana]
MTVQPSTANPTGQTGPLPWEDARAVAYAAGVDAAAPPVEVPLADADGATLAYPLLTRTDLPAFPTSSVDGFAVRGPGPWRVIGRVLAGTLARPLAEDGVCVEIATGAAVPPDTTAIVRTEDSTREQDGRVSGTPRSTPEWREPGEEARLGEELLPAGTAVNPAVIGLAASCGYDTLGVRAAPTTAVLVFGDELLTSGLPGDGRVRDSLGPSVPAWLRRLGAAAGPVLGPVEDTLEAHVEALNRALAGGAELICTTGGTMSGPVDHLHPALAQLGAAYLVNTVEVRPGFPMLLASVPRPGGGTTLVAGLPGNPQSAVVALVSLVAPAVAGLSGRPMPALPTIRLSAPVGARGGFTHLALVDSDGVAVSHAASSMLRGMARAVGFAVIPPNSDAVAGDEVALVPLPLLAGERP